MARGASEDADGSPLGEGVRRSPGRGKGLSTSWEAGTLTALLEAESRGSQRTCSQTQQSGWYLCRDWVVPAVYFSLGPERDSVCKGDPGPATLPLHPALSSRSLVDAVRTPTPCDASCFFFSSSATCYS